MKTHFTEIRRPDGARRLRCEVSPEDREALVKIAREGGVALAAVTRLALSLVARGRSASRASLLHEIEAAKRTNAWDGRPAENGAKRRKGP